MPNTQTTRLTTTISETRAAVLAARQEGETIGFVPTMGALHAGHLRLVEASLATCDRTVVSIFVNPTQFAPGEDLQRYPRVLEQDLHLLEQLGVWLAFAPTTDEMYPDGCETSINVGRVAQPLEGAARPNHFRGVATVVLKLLQIVPADCAFFGQKDYQQTLVIKQFVHDLSVPIDLEICPTVRESDGLAMSSRNAYLTPAQREQALSLWQALQLTELLYTEGEKDTTAFEARLQSHFSNFPEVAVEYIAFLAAGTVNPVSRISGPTVVAIAARVGETRLIDNLQIG